jgi:hypothetical protein
MPPGKFWTGRNQMAKKAKKSSKKAAKPAAAKAAVAKP